MKVDDLNSVFSLSDEEVSEVNGGTKKALECGDVDTDDMTDKQLEKFYKMALKNKADKAFIFKLEKCLVERGLVKVVEEKNSEKVVKAFKIIE